MKLKPCPFCGGKCCVCESGCRGWMAHCHDCDCTITVDKYNNAFATQVQADMAWNTRAEQKEDEGNVTADADVEAYQNRQKSIALGEPLLEQGYWSCPKCGDGYKHKGAARKCCQRGKE